MKGTTAGQGAEQHTGTGLVERHVGLQKLTMQKIKAELNRQGSNVENDWLAAESAMAANQTMSYGGVTPAMAVFGILPRGFYEEDSTRLMATTGALQTDLSVYEKALRMRQISLSAVQQSVIEDRIARANRTRPQQLPVNQLVAGTSEMEF